jgi:multiple sugar transport system permease protein
MKQKSQKQPKRNFIQEFKNSPPDVRKEKVRKFFFGSKESDGFCKLFVVYALLICIGFVYLYPLFYMISSSFMDLEDLLDTSVSWIPSKLNFENYINAAKSMSFWNAFFKSVVIAGVPTIINVIVCAFVGYGFARFEFRGKYLFMGILIFSYILPSVITMMPTYVLYNNLGLVGHLTSFIIPSLLGQGLNCQIFILIFYQFFRQVPKVLIEAGQVDGAGYLKSFLRISLPSAAPAILTVFLFSIVWYWNESYLTQMYVTGIYANQSIWTTLVIELKKFNDNYGTATAGTGTSGVTQSNNESIQMAATMLSILPVLIMYFILQRQFVESIDNAGITGE